MAYTFKQDLLPEGHRNRPGYAMKPKGLLFHTTNNWSDGTGDEAHAEYMESTTCVVSWHETVDKDSVTQHIPHSENAWHAGDGGSGHYNRNWIGMEIACEAVAPGQKLDKATYSNAVDRAAQICIRYGFGWDQLQPHKIVYGKNCPHDTLLGHNKFKEDVFAKVAEIKGQKVDKPTIKINDRYLHVVEKGQTLSGIAERYDKSVDYLARLNGLSDPDKLYVGQRLKLVGIAPKPEPKKHVKHAKPKVTTVKERSGTAVRKYPGYALKKGMNDKRLGTTDIMAIQRAVDVKPDGVFGTITHNAVAAYQRRHGLVSDGIVGPKTWDKMF